MKTPPADRLKLSGPAKCFRSVTEIRPVTALFAAPMIYSGELESLILWEQRHSMAGIS